MSPDPVEQRRGLEWIEDGLAIGIHMDIWIDQSSFLYSAMYSIYVYIYIHVQLTENIFMCVIHM